ncbi:MAG TPA: DUF58 domain-containing protein [Verrucomicrobiae bacterium]|nr:DUF58 domain-containing protein [Verrucomicrobiae bacterium]
MRPLFKAVYRLFRLVSGVRYRLGRRLTPAGIAVAGAVVLAAIMGPDTEANVVYQGFVLLVCLLLVAACFTGHFRFRFSAQRQLPRFATAGTPMQYSVELRNLTGANQAGLTLLETLADPRPSFEDWFEAQLAQERQMRPFRLSASRRSMPFVPPLVKPAAVPTLAPGQEERVRLELTPLRRGVLRFAAVTLARPDPLGLVRSFQTMELPQTVLVLPRRYPLPPLALPGTMKYQQGGVAQASRVGQSEEFVALRDYRRGDPLRHIHWRTWAKAGKPVVREFEDEFFVRHALVLDTFAEPEQGAACEEAISIAASFACTIITQESLLDLLFVGPESYSFTAGRNLAHADQMLEILAAVRPCRDKPFRELEHLVLSHVSVVSGCICVLLAWDSARRALVDKLQALGVPVLVLVVVEPGRAKEVAAALRQAAPERYAVLEVGAIEEGLAKLQ